MYRELILEAVSNGEPVRFGAPCSDREIEAAEKVIGYAFPQELRKLLGEINGDGWLLLSVDQMIETVQLNRTYFPECFDSREEYEDRIDRHIFFAGNGCGDYYCYRVGEDGKPDESAILIWEHELFETRYAAKDIADLIGKYYRSEI